MKSTTILSDLLRLSPSESKQFRRQVLRFVLVLILFAVAALFACSSPPEDDSSAGNSSSDDMETAADGFQESTQTVYDKAAGVEDVLQDAADARDAEIEEASDDN
jgi:hypothetical protein